MSQIQSQYHDEREAILDVMRENDKDAWQRFHACKLFAPHPAHFTFMAILEKHLEQAGKLRFDGDWEEVKAAQIAVYTTIYHLIGEKAEIAKEKAEELAEEAGLRGLRALLG